MTQKKKQPISVQLTKDDLKELLVILKNFMTKEIFKTFQMEVQHRMDCHNLRILNLEKTIVQHCVHDDKLDYIEYYTTSGAFLAANYKCKRCGKVNRKTWLYLSRKEKKGLKKLGVEI